MTATTEQKRPQIAPYWIAIAFFLLFAAALLIYHLITGTTPDRVAVHIEAFDFDIYWYGIWIVSGIALGCWVVAALAAERAQAVFQETVPADIRQAPLSSLGLPEEIEQKLVKKGFSDTGSFLYQWGLDPRNVGLKKSEIEITSDHLETLPQLEPNWISDTPWRIWNPDHVWNGIIWALVLGVIGARLYHVFTPSPSMAAFGIESPLDYFRHPFQLVNVRSGGLGIYGGLAGGALGLFIYTRRARIPMLAWADLAVVGLALGQAVGRWGNFFNQELYGSPTSLPWAIRIEPRFRLADYVNFDRFHPAFLYESIWSFLTFLLLYYLTKRYAEKLLPGEMMALYLILHAIGRSLLELVRLDSRTMNLAGLDVNLAIATVVSIVVAVVAAALVLFRRLRMRA